LVPRVGRWMPFLCALKFWLWLVWFLDLAISVEGRQKPQVRAYHVTLRLQESPSVNIQHQHRLHVAVAPHAVPARSAHAHSAPAKTAPVHERRPSGRPAAALVRFARRHHGTGLIPRALTALRAASVPAPMRPRHPSPPHLLAHLVKSRAIKKRVRGVDRYYATFLHSELGKQRILPH
jgi:hypothetical protein